AEGAQLDDLVTLGHLAAGGRKPVAAQHNVLGRRHHRVTVGRREDVLGDIIRFLASAIAPLNSGTCTAIWSPSKSALNAAQTSGWIWIAEPSTRTGMNAWMPRRCRVGARLRSTGWSRMTSSRTSQTSVRLRSTMRLADLMLVV